MPNPIIENIRRSLGRNSFSLMSPRPEIYPSRPSEPVEEEIGKFLWEIEKLLGVGKRLDRNAVADSIRSLVSEQNILKAALWDTPLLKELDVAVHLQASGVEVAPPDADKYSLAQCDLGITEADFLLAETGTIVLRSSARKPRAVSLLPATHLIIASPRQFRPDLHQVFAEAKNDPYLVFVTGASRTADIELVTTLGVHGPKNLYVWLLSE